MLWLPDVMTACLSQPLQLEQQVLSTSVNQELCSLAAATESGQFNTTQSHPWNSFSENYLLLIVIYRSSRYCLVRGSLCHSLQSLWGGRSKETQRNPLGLWPAEVWHVPVSVGLKYQLSSTHCSQPCLPVQTTVFSRCWVSTSHWMSNKTIQMQVISKGTF